MTGTTLVIGLFATMTACSDLSGTPRRSGADDVVTTSTVAPTGGSVRAPYTMKTSAQIASSITACFGSGVTNVASVMIESTNNPSGFLGANQVPANTDIVAAEALVLDGDEATARTGLRNATLSLAVFTALQDIGSVVGRNCELQAGTNPQCLCATPEAAHAMIGRCLPSIAPSQYAALESDFAASCAKSPAVAIASLVASTAFGAQ